MKSIFTLLILAAIMMSACTSARFYHDDPPLLFSEIDYTFPMQVETINGVPLAWYDSGGSGDAVLLVHGLASNAGFWRANVADLRAAGLRVIAVDLPGYGKSGKAYATPYSLAFYAETLDALLGRLGVNSCTVAGHSMGGQIAMTMVLMENPRVKQLVLLSPAGIEKFGEGEGRWLATTVTPEFVVATTEERVRINLASNFYCWSDDYEWMVEERVRMAKDPEFERFAYAVSRCVSAMIDEPVWMDLGKVNVPVLILGGENDNLIPNPYLHGGYTCDVMRHGAEAMPQARLLMIEKAGHMLQLEQPEAVNRAIVEYLAGK